MFKPKITSHTPTIITKTPQRLTLAGGGTDVLWYSSLRGGDWISAAINKYIYVWVYKYSEKKHIKLADGINKTVITNMANINNDIIRECLLTVGIDGGISIDIRSDTSAKSGLGGSGSLEVGLLHALHAYKGTQVKPHQLAREASAIEIAHLKRSVGPQDQYVAALGGINYFEIDTNGKVTWEPLKLSIQTLANLKNNLLFFSTGIQKDTEKILADERNNAKDQALSFPKIIGLLDRIKDLGQEAKIYLLTGKTDKFGQTLHRHWLLKRSLSDKVTSPIIDRWYNEAVKAGSLGGKIMGAGGGGWFVFYVNKNHADFIKHMQKKGLLHQSVDFDWEGTRLL